MVDANIVTGGEAELQGKVQSTIENLWSSYPHADHIAIGQNILSTTCYLLKESDLTGAQKIDRWLKFLEVFTPTLYVVKTQPPPAVRTPTPTVPTPSTPAFPCQERQVSAWLDKHGVYGGQLDYSIYDDKVDWIVNGKLSAKTRSEIVKDEEDFRKVYPVQKYTAQTSSTAIVRGECVLTQLLNSYKRSSKGKEEYSTYKVVFAISSNANGPRIVAQQIEVLPRPIMGPH